MVLSFPLASHADCVKKRVCDSWGQNCKLQDVCDSKFDHPDIGMVPLPEPGIPQPRPIENKTLIPPAGTTQCKLKLVNGFWQNVCQ